MRKKARPSSPFAMAVPAYSPQKLIYSDSSGNVRAPRCLSQQCHSVDGCYPVGTMGLK